MLTAPKAACYGRNYRTGRAKDCQPPGFQTTDPSPHMVMSRTGPVTNRPWTIFSELGRALRIHLHLLVLGWKIPRFLC